MMKAGQKIRVKAYGGEELVRVVLEEGDSYVVICREEEFIKAKSTGRTPQGVGFSKEFVIGLVE